MKSSPLRDGPQTKAKVFLLPCQVHQNLHPLTLGTRQMPNIKKARPRNIKTFQRDFFNDACRDDSVSTVSSISSSPETDFISIALSFVLLQKAILPRT